MELKDMTIKQMNRLYARIYRTLPYGGGYGWDWRTLHITYPAKYHLLRAVAWEHDQKLPGNRENYRP